MRKKRTLRLLGRALACVLASAVFWGWIFTFLTDTDPERKIVIYADMREFRWRELSAALEEQAPEGIRLVQVRPFTYALMNPAALEQADLYVMPESHAEEYADWILPAPERESAGLLLYDAETGEGAAREYLNYGECPGENWYLYFGARSSHAGGVDSAAGEIAERLLRLP